MRNGKFIIFIERKFRENEVENTSKKILNENKRISLVHFREFCSRKISIETLVCIEKS